MKMNDDIHISASRDRVYAALNDIEILKQAIPGCEELERQSETELTATVQVKVGPVKARFKGSVRLSDLNPPESYTISGEGKGAAAGFAKGRARVTLTELGEATRLRYEVEAEVGGKLAQVGSRLIEGTSKKLAQEFFEKFSALVEEGAPDPPPVAAPAPEAPSMASPVVMIVCAVVATVAAALILML